MKHQFRRFPFVCLVAAATMLRSIVATADWDLGDPHKMHYPQLPDTNGLDVSAWNTILADDWTCTQSGPVTGIHFWISWRGDNADWSNVQNLHLSIHKDDRTTYSYSAPQDPPEWTADSMLFNWNFRPAGQGSQGWYDPVLAFFNRPDHQNFFQVNCTGFVPPFTQQVGEIYWLDVHFDLIDSDNGGLVGWKTSGSQQHEDDAVFRHQGGWQRLVDPTNLTQGLDLAFVIDGSGGGGPQPDEFDFGDAPEGALAYPSSGVIGTFPTCQNVLIASWVQHALGLAHFTSGGAPQPAWDAEADGNGGLCPAFNPNQYNQDECFADGDAGLMIPGAYTITGPVGSETVGPCPSGTAFPLGTMCQNAAWGPNVDIWVVNNATMQRYVNVLMDWDQSGFWGGAPTCPAAGPAPEHVLVNFPVPAGYNGPLSTLGPPPFLIGPNPGYVWCRFSITDQQVFTDWDGSGVFADGESEDYLLLVEDEHQQEEADWGDAPTNYPTLSAAGGASHLIIAPPNPKLGVMWGDADPDGQPDPNALGDDNDGVDDEDGVTIPRLIPGRTAGVSILVIGGGGPGGWVEIWIDFDASGAWDASEKVVSAWYASGLYTIPVAVPADAAAGQTFARARINSVGLVGVGGQAPDGEVEDYEVFIEGRCPKWVQPPDCEFGLDMQSWTNRETSTEDGYLVADDWFCDGRPITAIDWWGSYVDWEPTGGNHPPFPRPQGFLLTWYTDVPADRSVTGYSHPGDVLRDEFVTLLPYGSNALGKGEVSERIFCTNTTAYLGHGGATQELEYAYHVDLEEPWLEKEGNIYWLSIQAVYQQDPGVNGWGWKTTAPEWNWLDDAVYHQAGVPIPWEEMTWVPNIPPWSETLSHPYHGESVNMAFRLLSDICPRRCKKWVQPPDMIEGMDMESWRHTDPINPPYVLRADDFISDGRPITDIHWWGSYSNWYAWIPGSEVDPVLAPTSFPWRPLGFQISWHTNDPSAEPCGAPAWPALYTNFVPMRFCHEVFYGTVTQHWMQPVPPATEYYEHEYQYYIDLLDPDVSGEPWLEQTNGHYWLDIQAVFTNVFVPYTDNPVPGTHAGWGWKTTFHVTNCVSVFSKQGGISGSWQEAFRTLPEHRPVDLAFELTTTNVPPPGSTNDWLAAGPFQFTNIWWRNVQVLSNGTPVWTDEVWLYSEGECGCGKQVLQMRSNLVEGTDWTDIVTNYVPRPFNIWTVTSDEPVEFYRIRFEN